MSNKERYLDLGTVYREYGSINGRPDSSGSLFVLERDSEKYGKMHYNGIHIKHLAEHMARFARGADKTNADALQYSNLQRQEIRFMGSSGAGVFFRRGLNDSELEELAIELSGQLRN